MTMHAACNALNKMAKTFQFNGLFIKTARKVCKHAMKF